MADKNEIDRWRRNLEEAESELELKKKQVGELQLLLCENVTALIQQQDPNNELQSELENLDISSRKSEDFVDLKKSLSVLINKTSKVKKSPENDAVQNLSTSVSTEDPSQFCAVLISEILYQLIEKISLPKNLTDRLNGLKTQLQTGVTMSKWAGMLSEMSDMASEVQLKINHERLDIEAFLKQITGRLKELDNFVQGSQNHAEESRHNGRALGEAVKLEMQNLVSSANSEIDIGTLKQQVQSGLAAVEKHFDEYKKAENLHHSGSNEDVQRLLERLSELEQESLKLKSRVQKERMLAQMDTLTGIPNRLGYDQYLAQEYARWKRFKNPLSLVIWDIDFFKRINDDYGHAAGDKALKTIATLLAGHVRETDYLARFGGEEFVLIMPGASAKSAKTVSEKLRETVESSGFHFKGEPVSITISAGIAEFTEDDLPNTVFERADKALYKAKENGRNQVVIFT